MQQLLNETKHFYDMISDLFSGFVCGFCTPKARNFFEFKPGQFTIRMNPSACTNIMYQYQYSLQMIDIFNSTIFPLVEFIKCTKDKMEDPEYALFIVDDFRVAQKKSDIEFCRDDPNWEDKKCADICEVVFGNFAIKMNFIRPYKMALKSKLSYLVSSKWGLT